jgi:hypothetical protein
VPCASTIAIHTLCRRPPDRDAIFVTTYTNEKGLSTPSDLRGA